MTTVPVAVSCGVDEPEQILKGARRVLLHIDHLYTKRYR